MKLPTLLALFFSLNSFAQTANKSISGTVKDITNEAVASATIKLLNTQDSSLVKGAVADGNGRFQFTSLLSGKYHLQITALGFKPYYSAPLLLDENRNSIILPVIILLPSKKEQLQAVTVTTRRPLIEQDIDKTIVNVEAMISAATSNTLEVLEKTPGVMVDAAGNISLNGKSGILVLIDGRSTYMSGPDLAAYLKSLPGGLLDRLELMDNPPAKYDAAGSAVINIRLKKAKNKGLTGSVTSSFSQGVKARVVDVLNLNYSRKKINLFGNFGYSTDGNYVNDFSDRKFFTSNGNLSSQVLLRDDYKTKTHGFTSRAGLDFTASPKTILGFQVNWQTRPRTEAYSFESKSYTNLSSLDALNSGTTNATYDWNNLGANFNFQHKINEKGRELSGDFNYIKYLNDGSPLYHNYSTTQSPADFTYRLKSGIVIYTWKTDYVQPLKNKMLFEAGIKSGFVTNDNNSAYFNVAGNIAVQDFSMSNHFIYKENINAAYVNVRKSWKRVGGQFGLRLENTQLEGNLASNPAINGSVHKQNFTDLFPSVFLNYKLDSLNKNSIGLALASRVNRPNYYQLNPFLVYRDKYSYTQGNPDLEPQYMYRVELRYQFKQILSVGLSYNRAANLVSQANEARGDTFISRPINITKGRMILLNTNLSLLPMKGWNLNLNAQAAYFKLIGDAYTEKINNGLPAARLNITNQFTFKKGWSGELSGYFSSKDIVGQVYLKSRCRIWVAAQKKIWNDKGSVRISVEDIFHSWVQVENSFAVKQSEFYHRNETDTQRIGLALTYRFGSDSFGRKRKNTDNAADEEKGRAE